MKSIVYIAGQITGTDDYMERFKKAEEEVKHMFNCVPINPTMVSATLLEAECDHEQFMEVTKSLLKCCDTIYLLKGWQNSAGAVSELKYALYNDYKILTE